MSGVIKDLGPCNVLFDDTAIGETKGGVNFRYTTEDRPINEDSKGVTPVDNIFVGGVLEVEVMLTRASLAQLAAIIPNGSVSGTKLEVDNSAGLSQFDNAAELVLKPKGGAGFADLTSATWLTVPLAYPTVDLDVAFNVDDQRVYKVVFKGFPNASSGLMWFIGV